MEKLKITFFKLFFFVEYWSISYTIVDFKLQLDPIAIILKAVFKYSDSNL